MSTSDPPWLARLLPAVGWVVFVDRKQHESTLHDLIKVLPHLVAAGILRFGLRHIIGTRIGSVGLPRKGQARKRQRKSDCQGAHASSPPTIRL